MSPTAQTGRGTTPTHIIGTAERLRSADFITAVPGPTDRVIGHLLEEKKRNALLASLSRATFLEIESELRFVSLPAGAVLNEPGQEVDSVLFPDNGMASVLAVMRDGRAIETATVGREGALGMMAGLGLHITLTRAVAQTAVR